MKRVLTFLAAATLLVGAAAQGEKESKKDPRPQQPSRERRSEPRVAQPSRSAPQAAPQDRRSPAPSFDPQNKRAPAQRYEPAPVDRGNPSTRNQPADSGVRRGQPRNESPAPRPSREAPAYDPPQMGRPDRTPAPSPRENRWGQEPKPNGEPLSWPSEPGPRPRPTPVEQGSKDPNPRPTSGEQGGKGSNPNPRPSPSEQGGKGQDPRPMPAQGLDPRPSGDTSFGGLTKRGKDGPAFQSRTGGIKPFTGPTHNQGDDPGLKKPPAPIPVRDGIGRGQKDDHRGSFGFQIGRMEDYRNGLRRGYCHWDPFWCDWNFGYRFYYFDPCAYESVFSPYYSYYCVPGYLAYVRVRIGSFTLCVPIGNPINYVYCGRGYANNYWYDAYNTGRSYGYGQFTNLDRALSDLTDAFKYQDPRLLDRLIGRSGSVEIFVNGEYAYSLDANDYYDITSDLVTSVRTYDFKIQEVRRTKGGELFVVARHDYRDTWNVIQSTWLTFTLREDRGYYTIIQAGTSAVRP
jgi:hypothetical protein